jgi:hypothetical protein
LAQESKEVEDMKKFLMALALLACAGSMALAGPNAGGTITLHYNPAIAFTPDAIYIDGGLQSCDASNPNGPADESCIWYAYAAFPDGSSPRLKAVVFGIDYDPNFTAVLWVAGEPGSVEIPTGTWPAAGSGNSVVLAATKTTQVAEFYTFAGYGPAGQTFDLGLNPDFGYARFADDSVPSLTDDVTDFGRLGFGGGGYAACPPPPAFGACCVGEVCSITTEADCQGTYLGDGTICEPETCIPDPLGACCVATGGCTITTQADCAGSWQGPGTDCDPNPCPTPVEESSWGQIKATYR